MRSVSTSYARRCRFTGSPSQRRGACSSRAPRADRSAASSGAPSSVTPHSRRSKRVRAAFRIEEATCVTSLELRRVRGATRDLARILQISCARRPSSAPTASVASSAERWAFREACIGAQVVEVDTLHASNDRPRDLLHFDLESADLLGYAWDFPTLVKGEELSSVAASTRSAIPERVRREQFRAARRRGRAPRREGSIGRCAKGAVVRASVSPSTASRFAKADRTTARDPRRRGGGDRSRPRRGHRPSDPLWRCRRALPRARARAGRLLDFADWPSTLKGSRVGWRPSRKDPRPLRGSSPTARRARRSSAG